MSRAVLQAAVLPMLPAGVIVNQRQAKRLACRTAAAVLATEWHSTGAAWAYQDEYGELTGDDLHRYHRALAELISELDRRGGDWHNTPYLDRSQRQATD